MKHIFHQCDLYIQYFRRRTSSDNCVLYSADIALILSFLTRACTFSSIKVELHLSIYCNRILDIKHKRLIYHIDFDFWFVFLVCFYQFDECQMKYKYFICLKHNSAIKILHTNNYLSVSLYELSVECYKSWKDHK